MKVHEEDQVLLERLENPQGLGGLDGLLGVEGNPGDPGDVGFRGAPAKPGSSGKIVSSKTHMDDVQTFTRKPYLGKPGSPGVRGSTGAPGFKGLPGEMGIFGPVGPSGLKGNPGLQGLKGRVGHKGKQGEAGPRGPHGRKGILGLAVRCFDILLFDKVMKHFAKESKEGEDQREGSQEHQASNAGLHKDGDQSLSSDRVVRDPKTARIKRLKPENVPRFRLTPALLKVPQIVGSSVHLR
ncbi:hypothetical protein F7725_027247 [Dissostichus mawsoni]|uniref:Uncharacterized protein n=1 Tax=Dissostichus mawsoni TaxID=36200 RepID=A0A7J5XDB2_DISMA|nr:hypothetical protein F7725_027247 [Dissostichus mawsoni]